MKEKKLQMASEGNPGSVRLASISECLAGIDQTKVITPFTLNRIIRQTQATEGREGVVRLATRSEALAGVDNRSVITCSKLGDVIWAKTSRLRITIMLQWIVIVGLLITTLLKGD